MQQNKRTLVLGATPNPSRYAFLATNMLKDFGHDTVLYGIKKGEIAGQTILNSWPEDEKVDTVTLYVNPKIQVDYYQKIFSLDPKRIIFNPGTENPELERMAEERGIEALEACTLVLLRTNQF